jgi:hypothetical protein
VTKPSAQSERRSYSRVQAHVAVRPVSVLARAVPRRVNDVSLGGLRCYSDDDRRPGERLELELFFPDGQNAVVLAEVIWIDVLPAGSPARFDIGLRYLDCSPESLALIERAVQPRSK